MAASGSSARRRATTTTTERRAPPDRGSVRRCMIGAASGRELVRDAAGLNDLQKALPRFYALTGIATLTDTLARSRRAVGLRLGNYARNQIVAVTLEGVDFCVRPALCSGYAADGQGSCAPGER